VITLRFDQLVQMTGGKLRDGTMGERSFRGVSIDSRTVQKDQLFVALRGERTDGHRYIGQALLKGASGVLAESDFRGLNDISKDAPVVSVPDSHAAMITLAKDYRSSVPATRAGITGSNGKTTTKELAYQLLSAVERDVYRSPGNFNNLYGMPLALLSMPDTTKVAVLEMGISTPGEMARLADLVKPDIVLITNVGATHLEFLETVEGVARAKLEVVQTMSPEQPLIINADDPVLIKEASHVRTNVVTFGINESATYSVRGVEREDSGYLRAEIDGHQFRLPLFGGFQIYNLLAAYALVKELGYSLDSVDTAALSLTSSPMRGESVSSRDVTFIVDCYNANPDSVKVGLRSFGEMQAPSRRVVILGDMLELGKSAERLHREIGRVIADTTTDLVILVGPLSKSTAEEAVKAGLPGRQVLHFETVAGAADRIANLLYPGDLVYVKGSRGIGLEVIIQRWTSAEEGS
jgi:UDP-N-acetylmuramoyl-tripeptide--D-alanyl-D-alanine ligase